jgi:cytochrome c
VRYNPDLLEVADGALTLHTGQGDIYAADNFGPRGGPDNLILQSAPTGDWTIETRMDPSFTEQYQQGGLLAYLSDDDYVKFDLVTDNPPGEPLNQRLELRSEIGGEIVGPQENVATDHAGPWWLRLTKSGSTFSASYSTDGETWTDFPASVENGVVDGEAFGIYTLGWSQQESKPAAFDHFRLLGEDGGEPDDVTAPTVEVSLSGDRIGDDFLGAVTVEVDASDEEGGSGLASVEYRLDGGDWVVYDEPFTVDEPGDHAVEARATDEAGNVSEVVTVTFTVVEDECPDGDDRATVVIDGIDSQVDNIDTGDGCTIADLIDQDAEWRNHGQFVSHVSGLLEELEADALIDDREADRINSAAARSGIGKPAASKGKGSEARGDGR